MIHLERWRVTNPLVMMELQSSGPDGHQQLGQQLLPQGARASYPSGPRGGARGEDPTGLDKELAAAVAAQEKEAEKPAQRAEEPKRSAHPRGSVGALLEKKAAERRAALQEKEKDRKKKQTEKDRSRSRGRRKRRGRRSSIEEEAAAPGHLSRHKVFGSLVPGGRSKCGGYLNETSSRRIRRRRVDEQQGDGVHQPSGVEPASTASIGVRNQRATDLGKGPRHAAARSPGRAT